jgi:alcohol dehydrogenase class IV
MVVQAFNFSGIPQIMFGAETLRHVIRHPLIQCAQSILLVTGKTIRMSADYQLFVRMLRAETGRIEDMVVSGEPSPDLIDDTTAVMRSKNIDLVIAVGGGSVLDAAKAISAMIPQKESVSVYLEGFSHSKKHNGIKVPLIAVPTTSGTGSEATKNAVLSQVGPEGYKRSLRHANFVPDLAVIDPTLMISCPRDVTANSGLDALSQLMESYLSTHSSILTDTLALSALKHFSEAFLPVCTNESKKTALRGAMAYAALISGIALANAGLGIVHGFASPIGGFFPISHGVVCGRLLAEATRMNIQCLEAEHGGDHYYLKKYADVANLIAPCEGANSLEACKLLVETIEQWTESLQIPLLSAYGITEVDFDRIIAATSIKNNPVNLTKDQMKTILINCL